MPFVSVKSETLNEEKAGEIGYVGIENGIETDFFTRSSFNHSVAANLAV